MSEKFEFSLMRKWVLTQIRLSDAALALLGTFIFSALVSRLTNKGPMLWPVMGIIPTIYFHIKEIYDYVTEILIKCQGTFHYRGMWMGRAYGIMTVDPINIEYILKKNFKNFPKGKYYRERFSDLLGDGIFNADGEVWKNQRRAATLEMHSTKFMNFSLETMHELVHQKLLKLLHKLANSSQIIDLQEILLRFTFDNICMAAFGVNPGCLALDLPEVPFAKAFEEATELTLFRFTVPPFIWKPLKLFGLGSEKKLKKAVQIVHEFAENTVSDRIESSKVCGLTKGCDLLSRLIDFEYPDELGKKCRFSDKFLKDFCISFILAGRDTSSVALVWFFWLICNHPHVESHILEEIKKYGEKEMGFTIEDLKKMVYLQAALSESLRLYPSVPIDIKEVEEEDVLPSGVVVLKGARVFYSIYSMGRMESIWGKDCMEFKPERWIKDGEFVSENPFKYAVFNGGPRLCIGKKFAYMQMKMVAASILMRYKVKVVEGQMVAPKMTTTLYMKNGLLVTFEPR